LEEVEVADRQEFFGGGNMFALIRLTRLGYVVGLAALVIALCGPRSSNGQVPASRAPVAPLLGAVNGLMQTSQQQAQTTLLLMGQSGGFGGGIGGFGGGFAGQSGGFAGGIGGIGGSFPGGFGGFAGKGLGGFNGGKGV
jgi:hypothetical protein